MGRDFIFDTCCHIAIFNSVRHLVINMAICIENNLILSVGATKNNLVDGENLKRLQKYLWRFPEPYEASKKEWFKCPIHLQEESNFYSWYSYKYNKIMTYKAYKLNTFLISLIVILFVA